MAETVRGWARDGDLSAALGLAERIREDLRGLDIVERGPNLHGHDERGSCVSLTQARTNPAECLRVGRCGACLSSAIRQQREMVLGFNPARSLSQPTHVSIKSVIRGQLTPNKPLAGLSPDHSQIGEPSDANQSGSNTLRPSKTTWVWRGASKDLEIGVRNSATRWR